MPIKSEKLLQMIYLLLENDKLSAQVLADKLGVSVRTIFRYVDSLTQAGFPVYVLKGRNGGIAMLPQFKLNNTLVNKDEQVDILASLQSLRSFEVDDGATLEKLSAIFKQDPISWLKVDPTPWLDDAVQKQNITLLREAILQKKFLQFNYINSKNEAAAREVYPYQVLFKDRAWYLSGYSLEKRAPRVFKLTRMDKVQFMENPPQTISGAQPWLEVDLENSQINHRIKVELQISHQLRYKIFEEFPKNDIKLLESGDYLVTTEMNDDGYWLVDYLLSYGSKLQVLKPESLRTKIKQEIEKMLRKY